MRLSESSSFVESLVACEIHLTKELLEKPSLLVLRGRLHARCLINLAANKFDLAPVLPVGAGTKWSRAIKVRYHRIFRQIFKKEAGQGLFLTC